MSNILSGFLLQKSWQDINEQLVLTFYFKTHDQVAKVIIDDEKPLFFIEQQHSQQAFDIISRVLPNKQSWSIKPVELQSFHFNPVCAIYFNSQKQIYLARQALSSADIQTFESDVNPASRYLMERFIHASAMIQCNEAQPSANKFRPSKSHPNFSVIHNPKLKSVDHFDHIEFCVMSLDIETSIVDERLLSIACTSYQYPNNLSLQRDVFILSTPKFSTDDEYIHICLDEAQLLREFVAYFLSVNPDIIIGWSVVDFDFNFLQNKSKQFNVPLNLGRNQETIVWQSRRDDDSKRLIIEGRVVVDGIDALKNTTYQLNKYSLDFVANHFLGKGKLIDHPEQRALEIVRLFEDQTDDFIAYNIEDCDLVWEIFIKADLFGYLFQREQLTGLPLNRLGGSVEAFDYRYLPLLHRKGFVAPNTPIDPEGVGSPGGYVFDSIAGLYQNILVFDYKSLYPSIIQTFKVDPLGLAVAQNDLKLSANYDQQETIIDDKHNYIAGFNQAVFNKGNQILPELITQLWAARDDAKANKLSARSQAIKIIMNSFYGVLGTPGCRFFNHQLPSSITLRGHQILTESKRWFEQKGLQVIYGDTDSIFVHLSQPCADITEYAQSLQNELNQYWQDALQQRHQIQSHLELEFEAHYQHFVMPRIRGMEKGSKKRYAGLKHGEHTADDIIFKGLEAVRSDWTEVAQKMQRQLFFLVFTDQDKIQELLQTLIIQLKNKELDSQLLFKKRLRKPLSEFTAMIPPHIQAILKLPLTEQAKYQRGSPIEYVMTLNGPEIFNYSKSPLNYDWYIEKQIQPICDDVLQFIGSNFEQTLSFQGQLNL
ncbi:DNA polymerase II [Marinicellulosiphila megalodicopiae]|uniref:DNA polymerase II n=1 Tax=Marinicellulosiphila megalodicopiae TaxID=2724896 RepID=UPI003BB11301